MRLKILNLVYSEARGGFDPGPAEEFLKDKRLRRVREHFYSVDGTPHLALVIEYEADLPENGKPADQPPKWKRELRNEDLPLFQSLREWRNQTARKRGIPPYVIFDNTQLAALARLRPSTKAGLTRIEGIGEKKAEAWWAELSELLEPAGASEPASSVPMDDEKASLFDSALREGGGRAPA